MTWCQCVRHCWRTFFLRTFDCSTCFMMQCVSELHFRIKHNTPTVRHSSRKNKKSSLEKRTTLCVLWLSTRTKHSPCMGFLVVCVVTTLTAFPLSLLQRQQKNGEVNSLQKHTDRRVWSDRVRRWDNRVDPKHHQGFEQRQHSRRLQL